MSKARELTDYLNDIITAIADVEEFTQGISYEAFVADKKTVNAGVKILV
jgi:uncharacterized protein with HEPN domain